MMTSLAPLSIDMYLPALPFLQGFFHADANAIQLTLASFFVAFALGQLFYGPLSDAYGRKKPLYAGVILFIFASIGCVWAKSVEMLIFLRFLQALGACAGIVIARAIVSDLFRAEEAAGIYSSMMMISGVAPILAPIIGGSILGAIGWEAIFYLLAFLGMIVLLSSFLGISETREPSKRSALKLSKALASYSSLLRHRHYLTCTLTGGLAMAGLFAYIAGSPFLFIEHFGLSEQGYAILFGVNAVGLVLGSQINARLLRRYSSTSILSRALLCQSLCALLLLVQAYATHELFSFVIPLFGYITALGFILPNTTALAMAHFTSHAGSASALLGTIQFVLAGILTWGVGSLGATTPLMLGFLIAVCGWSAIAVFLMLKKRAR